MTPEFIRAIAPVRKWLAAGAPGHIEFDMTEIHCGTAMCIAGAIMEFNGTRNQTLGDIGPSLGMTLSQIAQLFAGVNADHTIPEPLLSKITPAMAVDAIDQMLATGEVNWRTDV